jgi:hypothetical protein
MERGGFVHEEGLSMQVRNGIFAQYHGQEYEAEFVPSRHSVTLRSDDVSTESLGFVLQPEGFLALTVDLSDVESVSEIQTYCKYRGRRCSIGTVTDYQAHIYLDSFDPSLAAELEFTSPERAVFTKWVPIKELENVHEEYELLWPA